MKTIRFPKGSRLLATLTLTSSLFLTEAARAFEIQDLMSHYNQAETLALTQAARQAGFQVDPHGFRESVRGTAFVALLPIKGGAEATREEWARGRDVAVMALRPNPGSQGPAAGLYVLHVLIARGEARSALIRIDKPADPIWIVGTVTKAECGGIDVGEDYACINQCIVEFHNGQWVTGNWATCFSI